MSTGATDAGFDGSIPELYERYMVPLMFEAYAQDLVARVALHRPASVLEIACGTGALTRELARRLPAGTSIVATDLNAPMLAHARRIGTARPVTWQQADAMRLPFPDESFDAVACQFGVMFLPDRSLGYAEMRRVLRPGGHLAFNVWGCIEANEFAHAVSVALRKVFPDDPPLFMERVPHGYFDTTRIAADLSGGGFTRGPEVVEVSTRSRAATPRIPAIAICQGTPLRTEIETRRPGALEHATDVAAEAIERRFGPGPVDGRMRALVLTVRR